MIFTYASSIVLRHYESGTSGVYLHTSSCPVLSCPVLPCPNCLVIDLWESGSEISSCHLFLPTFRFLLWAPPGPFHKYKLSARNPESRVSTFSTSSTWALPNSSRSPANYIQTSAFSEKQATPDPGGERLDINFSTSHHSLQLNSIVKSASATVRSTAGQPAEAPDDGGVQNCLIFEQGQAI